METIDIKTSPIIITVVVSVEVSEITSAVIDGLLIKIKDAIRINTKKNPKKTHPFLI